MYKVLIASFLDADSVAELPYVLKKGGCNVDVFCSNTESLKDGSYYDKWIAAENEPAQFAEQLTNLVYKKQYDWVILGDETLIRLMNDKVQDEQLFRKILPLTSTVNRNVLASESGLIEFFHKNAIATPGFIIHQESKNSNVINYNIKFPVILTKEVRDSGEKSIVAKSKQQLIAELKKMPVTEKVVIKEFIKGDKISVEALFMKGELISYAVSEIADRNSSYPPNNRKYFENRSLEKHIITLGDRLGINGFASLVYINSENNGYYLIKADLNPNAWITTRQVRTVFIEGIKRVSALISSSHRPVFTFSKSKREVVLFYKDIRLSIEKNNIKGLLKWIINYKYWKFIPFYDFRLLLRIANEISTAFIQGKSDLLTKLKIKKLEIFKAYTMPVKKAIQ